MRRNSPLNFSIGINMSMGRVSERRSTGRLMRMGKGLYATTSFQSLRCRLWILNFPRSLGSAEKPCPWNIFLIWMKRKKMWKSAIWKVWSMHIPYGLMSWLFVRIYWNRVLRRLRTGIWKDAVMLVNAWETEYVFLKKMTWHGMRFSLQTAPCSCSACNSRFRRNIRLLFQMRKHCPMFWRILITGQRMKFSRKIGMPGDRFSLRSCFWMLPRLPMTTVRTVPWWILFGFQLEEERRKHTWDLQRWRFSIVVSAILRRVEERPSLCGIHSDFLRRNSLQGPQRLSVPVSSFERTAIQKNLSINVIHLGRLR